MDNQNAKLKSKLYVKLLTKFSNMPVKWPFKILLGGDGSVLQHGINGFLQKKIKISQKQETEMILTLISFNTIQVVFELNIDRQSYFFAKS